MAAASDRPADPAGSYRGAVFSPSGSDSGRLGPTGTDRDREGPGEALPDPIETHLRLFILKGHV